jgi:predicted secreted protein
MSKQAGRISTLEVSADGGATYLEVKGASDITLNSSQAELTTTSHDSGQYEEYIPGRKDFTIDLGLRYDETDPGQANMVSAFYSGTVMDFRFRMQVGTGLKQWLVKGFCTSLTPAGPNDDVASMDATIRCTGPLTLQVQ